MENRPADGAPVDRSKHEQRLAEAEQALRESEAVYLSLVESLPLAVFRKDPEFRLIFGNKRFCDTLNKPLEEFRGKTDFELFPPELAEKYRRDDIKVLETGEVLEVFEEFSVADGTRREIHVLKGPIRDADGRIVGVQGMFWDVSEHKEALRASETRYRELFENANDLVYTADLKGRFTSLNKAGEELSGYARDEIIGRDMSLLVAPRWLGKAREMTRRKLETHDRTTYEIEIQAKDGHRVPVEVGSRLIYENGEPVAIQGIVRDITERKRAEEQLRVARDAADEARRIAETASRAKSDFLANMSHEIRTPMNAIIGMTELLLDTDLSPAQRDYLKMVHESGDSLLMLLNDILDFSKIEAGKLDLEYSTFDLRESIGDTMKSLALRAHDKHLELAMHIHSDVPFHLMGDVGRLRQIVVNLVGNAIKFTEQGEVVVNVQCASPELRSRSSEASEVSEASGVARVSRVAADTGANSHDSPYDSNYEDGEARLHFAVADTGIGIAEEKCATIFDKFVQADTSTTRSYGGTGLGLAISSRLVGLMGGRIWVESEVGRGSTFHFTVRFDVADVDAVERARVRHVVVSDTPVLIVDDNATNRRILEEVVGNWGMKPTLVSDARMAIERLRGAHEREEPFRLVITDVNMPDVDGFTLCEWIRNEPDVANVVIIVLTSAGRPGDNLRREKLNIAAHLMKPVKQSELFNAIVMALGVTSPEDESPQAADVPESRVGPLHVLLVEDNLVNQKLAIGVLGKQGHEVTVSNNGQEAVDALASRTFDLVLMDVQMPVMDGFEATRIIRERERQSGKHIPIVAMTARAMKGDRERCLEAGMDAYVAKPIRIREVYATIERLCSDTAGGDTSSAVVDGQRSEDSHEQELIDWSVAFESAESDSDLLRLVAGAFVDDCPKYRDDLAQAIASSDAAAVRQVAHGIKGALAAFGATRALELSERLELMGHSGNLDDAAACFDLLDPVLKNTTVLLAAFAHGDFHPRDK